VYLFALSRKEMCHYRAVMNTCAVLALVLAGLDLLALAPPGLIEAMVQRAPTWEQVGAGVRVIFGVPLPEPEAEAEAEP